jgi:hypothetical protein
MVQVRYSKQEVDYLTIQGIVLTPNKLLYGSITGPITSTTSTDWKGQPNYKELALNFKIGKKGETISGQLTINFLVIDPMEGAVIQKLPMNQTSITQDSAVRFVIANGSATAWIDGLATNLGNMNVPTRWQVQFVVSGTKPFFPIEGTYEAKE